MNPNARFFFTGIALSAAMMLASCTTCPFDDGDDDKGEVSHCVFVWLKRPGNQADRAKLIETARMLQREIPEIDDLTVGQMLPSPRPIVDSSYDVGFVMEFEDKAAMDRYEQHPAHQKAAKEILLPMAKKVQVFDFTAE